MAAPPTPARCTSGERAEWPGFDRYDSEFVNLYRTSLANVPLRGLGRRRLAAFAMVIALAATIGGATGGVAGATAAQDPSITSTSGALGTEPAGAPDVSTTAAPAASGAVPATADESTPTASGRSEEIAEENRRIAMIVGALVAVAIALVLLTIRYWRATRPSAAASSEADVDVDVDADEDPTVSDGGTPPEDRRGRRSRRAVAGADHAGADDAWEPKATGEQPRIDPPSSARTSRPSKQQRASALFGDEE